MKKNGKVISKLNFNKQTIVKLNDLQKILGGYVETILNSVPPTHGVPTKANLTKPLD